MFLESIAKVTKKTSEIYNRQQISLQSKPKEINTAGSLDFIVIDIMTVA